MQQLIPPGRQLILPDEEVMVDIQRDYARKDMVQEVYRLLFDADLRMVRRLCPDFEV